ncbi:MAG TPA: SpoIVB peptidase S55 domain-containing protein, partial [Thermoanaerobaculia bacterium]|nr:SpoIVB peptidase S55 domain-containing protein [Thermoanaerobaculia bacterium]
MTGGKSSWPGNLLASIAVLALTLGGGVAGAKTASSAQISGAEKAPPVLPIDQIRAGQTGYGLSVFAGLEPKRFKVEVLGVVRNTAPDQSMILAKLSGEGLESSGVVAGMSGSPVYIDGRLAGAVAFSWPFSKEPVAGITPIEEMRHLLDQPAAQPASRMEKSTPTLHDLLVGLPKDLLAQGLARLHRGPRFESFSGLSWSAAGFGTGGLSLIEHSLGNLAPVGGSSPHRVTEPLAPGSSVAGVLVDGDLRLAVVGTVTDRIGNTILAFGHPFLGVGHLRLPMAPADVVTVLASQYSSFKISNLGSIVGSFDLDRNVGVRGRIGLMAPMIPVEVDLRGEGERKFHLRVAQVPEITPTLIASSVFGAIDAAGHAAGDQSLDLVADFDLGERGHLAIRQSFDGSSAGLDSAVYLLGLCSYLERNSLADVAIRDLHVTFTRYQHPRMARLVAAHAGQTLVRPGESVQIALDLAAYRGDAYRRSVRLQLPSDLPEGRYSLLVGDGPDIDAARLLLEHLEPVSFSQALALLRSFHSRRDLVILGIFAAPGISVAGTVLPQLPSSMQSIWSAASSGGAHPLALSVAQLRSETLSRPINGLV